MSGKEDPLTFRDAIEMLDLFANIRRGRQAQEPSCLSLCLATTSWLNPSSGPG